MDPLDPETHYRIERSRTSIHEDGVAEGAPKWLVCEGCGRRVRLTRHRDDPGAWAMPHFAGCEYVGEDVADHPTTTQRVRRGASD